MSLAAIALVALILTILGVVVANLWTDKRLPSTDPKSKGINLIMSNRVDPDFPAQPVYTETKARNDSWTNITLTRKDADGSTTQTSKILPRGGKK